MYTKALVSCWHSFFSIECHGLGPKHIASEMALFDQGVVAAQGGHCRECAKKAERVCRLVFMGIHSCSSFEEGFLIANGGGGLKQQLNTFLRTKLEAWPTGPMLLLWGWQMSWRSLLYGARGNSCDQDSELFSSTMIPLLTVVVHLTRTEDELTLMPGTCHAHWLGSMRMRHKIL